VPEGDTVWLTAHRLDQALRERVLTLAELRVPALATADLTGMTVTSVIARGKHLLTRLDSGLTLHSHLRMDGAWHVHRTDEPPGQGHGRPRPEHGVRAVLANDTWTAVGHQLGMLDLVATAAEHTLVGHLGPDVLGSGWDPAEVVRRLTADPSRPVGEALLDQRVLAGVGTFFMAEALFLRGVSPWTPVSAAGDPEVLVALVHRLLAANRDRAVQSTTGDLRPGRREYVHARSGRPCLRCGGTVRVAPIGRAPQERTAFYCPACQPGPTPTDDGHPQSPLGSRSGGRPGGAGPRSGR